MTEEASDTGEQQFVVVVNDEEQYSVWATERPVPAGWRALETRGTRQECLEHIGRVWTDMRPRSLRIAMGEV